MSDLVRFETAGHTWTVVPDHEAFVREVLAPAAENPQLLPGAIVVKENRVRTVARLPEGPRGALFCKRYRVHRSGVRWASLVRSSPAAREWHAFRELSARGVSCPTPVVLAEARSWGFLGGCLLASLEAPDCEELVVYLNRSRAAGQEAERRQLSHALAASCHSVFQAGGDHPDMHLGNFLRHKDGSLLVLDLHSARVLGSPPGSRIKLRSLGKLAHSFGVQDRTVRAAAEEELRWFSEAMAKLDPHLGQADSLWRELVTRALRLEATRLKGRDRRCLVNSTEYVVQGPRGRRLYRRREITAQATWLALDAPTQETLHAHARGRTRLETFSRPAEFAAAGTELLRKLYLFPRLGARLAGLRDAPPLRAWCAARACEVRKIPVPRHYALVMEGVLPRRATIVMELISDAHMIHKLLTDPERLPSPPSRHQLARDLGALMGRFHRSGLKHHDLALQNLLACPAPGGEGWQLWVVDLDEVRVGPLSRQEKFRALTQLADLPPAATRSDRLRFFRAYLNEGGRELLQGELAEWGERGIGQRVAAGLQAKAAAKARRNRS